jgi:hypothetical protein
VGLEVVLDRGLVKAVQLEAMGRKGQKLEVFDGFRVEMNRLKAVASHLARSLMS